MRGFQPLPGSMTQKRPAMPSHKQYFEEPAPASLFTQYPTSNVLLVTGRRWRLLVIDLDGEEAQAVWPTLGQCPKTWVSCSGGGGQHYWFLVNRDYPRFIKMATLWKGRGKHSRIDLLCDNRLITVPPSYHVETGRQYKFLPYKDPGHIPMPAVVPGWVLALKPLPSDKPVKPIIGKRWAPLELSLVHDKVRLAREWGLRVTGYRPDECGWIACKAIDRRDDHPSCSFHVDSGVYYDHANAVSLGFIDLALALCVFPDRTTAIQELKKL